MGKIINDYEAKLDMFNVSLEICDLVAKTGWCEPLFGSLVETSIFNERWELIDTHPGNRSQYRYLKEAPSGVSYDEWSSSDA